MILKRTETNEIVNALYESSNILASKYDGKNLTIIFKRGASYTYNDVSKSDYMRFETADSQGVVMNKYIKQYSFTKNDNVNEIQIINEINESKQVAADAFAKILVDKMNIITAEYLINPVLPAKSIEELVEMAIKYTEMNGASPTLKLCACD